MIWLLAWLFPLWALLPRARALGAVSFQEVAGVGWQCAIRPPHDSKSWTMRGLNSWTGQGKSLGQALKDALRTASAIGKLTREGSAFAPVLGDHEFDDE